MSIRCSVCATPALAKFADASSELTAAALSRQAGQLGMDLTADRILTHRKHRADEGHLAPAKRKADLAVLIRDQVVQRIEEDPDFDIMDAKIAPGLGAGLKAQALLDKRESQQKKQTQADMLVALLGALRGEGVPVALLDDGNTIEGTAVVLDAE